MVEGQQEEQGDLLPLPVMQCHQVLILSEHPSFSHYDIGIDLLF
jgi:hypothetical protein